MQTSCVYATSVRLSCLVYVCAFLFAVVDVGVGGGVMMLLMMLSGAG